MAVSIEMRKPAVVDNRNMRRRIGAGLLVAAASITLAGVALQVSGGSKTVTQVGPTAAQRMAFVLEEHGYNLTQAPTAEQRIAFVLEEHGYVSAAAAFDAKPLVSTSSGLSPKERDDVLDSTVGNGSYGAKLR